MIDRKIHFPITLHGPTPPLIRMTVDFTNHVFFSFYIGLYAVSYSIVTYLHPPTHSTPPNPTHTPPLTNIAPVESWNRLKITSYSRRVHPSDSTMTAGIRIHYISPNGTSERLGRRSPHFLPARPVSEIITVTEKLTGFCLQKKDDAENIDPGFRTRVMLLVPSLFSYFSLHQPFLCFSVARSYSPIHHCHWP